MRRLLLPVCRAAVGCVLLLVCSAGAPSLLLAHGDLHAQITAASARIRKDPRNPLLYVERGQLYRAHRQWRLSLADCNQAVRLNAALLEAQLCRALTLAASDARASALRELTAVLERYPEAVDARLARARVLASLGRTDEADRDYGAALSRHAAPDWYLEWSAALQRARHPRAIAVLDDAIAQLGPLVTLQDAAIELDAAAGRFDSALARVESVLRQIPKSPLWLVRRADILERAKRTAEAHTAYLDTIEAVEGLPSGRRTRAVEQVLDKARTGAARTGAL